jgi:N-acetylmuramic acid 6-phosphate (MurNAc-6-P) etherase
VFSFNLFQQSVQTSIALGGQTVAVVSHEGATLLSLNDHALRCEFETEDTKGAARLETGTEHRGHMEHTASAMSCGRLV